MVHKSDYVTANGVPIVNPANIVNGTISSKNIMYISKDKSIELERYKLEVNDIVLARRGDLTKCTIVGNEQVDFICGTGSFFLHLISVLPQYFQLVYMSSYVQIILATECVGATMNNLNQSVLSQILFPLPPLAEQKRVVARTKYMLSIITTLDNEQYSLHTTIKQAKAKVLDLAIHGKLVSQEPNDEPASELLKRINPKAEIVTDNGHYQKIVPFEVPNKWKWCKLKDICTFLSRGKSPKYKDEDGTYPVFAQKCNLKDGGISLEQARFLDPDTLERWDEKYKLRNGDVLINSTGTGTVGRTRLFTEDCLDKYPFVVPDSHVSVVRTHVDVVSEFVYSYISSAHIQQYIEDNLAGSTNQKELYVGVLEEMDFPLPPLTEQKRIVSKIRSIFAQLDTIVATL